MSIYRRDEVLPEWEPIPYDMKGEAADAQERGFHSRAIKAIRWKRVPFLDFPAEGILGKDRDWFRSRDIDFVAQADGEDLVLWENMWSGFPDPPRWGLASRPTGSDDRPWAQWGHFPDLPSCWDVPGQTASGEGAAS